MVLKYFFISELEEKLKSKLSKEMSVSRLHQDKGVFFSKIYIQEKNRRKKKVGARPLSVQRLKRQEREGIYYKPPKGFDVHSVQFSALHVCINDYNRKNVRLFIYKL